MIYMYLSHIHVILSLVVLLTQSLSVNFKETKLRTVDEFRYFRDCFQFRNEGGYVIWPDELERNSSNDAHLHLPFSDVVVKSLELRPERPRSISPPSLFTTGCEPRAARSQ